MGLNVSAFTDFGFKMFLLSIVIMLLPESPFEHYITLFSDIPYLQYLNWFIPIGEIVPFFNSPPLCLNDALNFELMLYIPCLPVTVEMPEVKHLLVNPF